MKNSRAIALGGVLTALAAMILTLGTVIPIATYAAPLLAMAALLPVLEECGPRTAGASYAAAALLALLLSADREAALVYLVFGWYPILRPKIAALSSRAVRLAVKIAICTAAIALLYGALWKLLGLPEDLNPPLATALLALMANVLFLMADLALARFTLTWRRRLRKRFFR